MRPLLAAIALVACASAAELTAIPFKTIDGKETSLAADKGKQQHPLYAALTGEKGAFPGDVKWNFGKFLIGKDGKPLARFEPPQTPDSPELTAAIEKALE